PDNDIVGDIDAVQVGGHDSLVGDREEIAVDRDVVRPERAVVELDVVGMRQGGLVVDVAMIDIDRVRVAIARDIDAVLVIEADLALRDGDAVVRRALDAETILDEAAIPDRCTMPAPALDARFAVALTEAVVVDQAVLDHRIRAAAVDAEVGEAGDFDAM